MNKDWKSGYNAGSLQVASMSLIYMLVATPSWDDAAMTYGVFIVILIVQYILRWLDSR